MTTPLFNILPKKLCNEPRFKCHPTLFEGKIQDLTGYVVFIAQESSNLD